MRPHAALITLLLVALLLNACNIVVDSTPTPTIGETPIPATATIDRPPSSTPALPPTSAPSRPSPTTALPPTPAPSAPSPTIAASATQAPPTAISPAATVPATPAVQYQVYGLSFGPFIGEGEDPNRGTQLSEDQLRARMGAIAPYTQWIRTFGTANGLAAAGAIAHQLDLKIALGAWLSSNTEANEREITALISAARQGQVDLAVVGNESLLNGYLTADQLIGYLKRVKEALPGIQVTTAEGYAQILAHPGVVSAVDVVMVSYYPFWEGVDVRAAVAVLHQWHEQVKAIAGGRQVIVAETGWPDCGSAKGDAVPSPDNASFYFLNFVSWARATNTPFFYFEAYNEGFKAQAPGSPGPAEACFGVWDKEGHLKAGRDDVFAGKTMADNWTPGTPPVPEGPPTIEFTHIPAYGSTEDLRGRVLHVNPADYRVAVYINVNGGWWTKPTAATPLVVISPDGTWVCDVTTGGDDIHATGIAVYLVPRTYTPPLMSGGAMLPTELQSSQFPTQQTTRTPSP